MATTITLTEPPAADSEIAVLGIGDDYTELQREHQAAKILEGNQWCFWWSHSIRGDIQPLLQNGFSLFLGQRGGTFIARLRVRKFSSNAQGHASPFPEFTDPDQRDKAEFGAGKNEKPRTWFLVDLVEKIDPPISFADIGPAALRDETGEEYCGRPYLGSWGYRWRDIAAGTAIGGTAPVPTPTTVTPRTLDVLVPRFYRALHAALVAKGLRPEAEVFFNADRKVSCAVEVSPEDGLFAIDVPALQRAAAAVDPEQVLAKMTGDTYKKSFNRAWAKLGTATTRLKIEKVVRALHGPLHSPGNRHHAYSVAESYYFDEAFLNQALGAAWPRQAAAGELVSIKRAAHLANLEGAPVGPSGTTSLAPDPEDEDEDEDDAPSGERLGEIVRKSSGKPFSLVLRIAGEPPDGAALERRREGLRSLMEMAFDVCPAVRVLERLPGKVPFQPGATGSVASPTPTTPLSRAAAMRWAHESGADPVFLRLVFPNQQERENFEDKSRAIVPLQIVDDGPLGFLDAPPSWPARVLDITRKFALPEAPNVVLEGVPGTGKTYFLQQIRAEVGLDFLGGCGEGPWAITLHPATSYEDFVEGLRPGQAETLATKARVVLAAGAPAASAAGGNFFMETPETQSRDDGLGGEGFTVHGGFFLRACRAAIEDPYRDYVVLLDEINRCNIPKVFGDLLTTLERSKRARWDPAMQAWDLSGAQTVTLPYSKRTLFVPDNIFVVATMNSTDRSVAPMDAALRRRFAFRRVWPKGFETGAWSEAERRPVLNALMKAADQRGGDQISTSFAVWVQLNENLLLRLGPDGMLGHSYLFDLACDMAPGAAVRLRGAPSDPTSTLCRHWNDYILPQLADILETNNAADLASGLGQDLVAVLSALRGVVLRKHSDGKGMMQRAIFHFEPNPVPSPLPSALAQQPEPTTEQPEAGPAQEA